MPKDPAKGDERDPKDKSLVVDDERDAGRDDDPGDDDEDEGSDDDSLSLDDLDEQLRKAIDEEMGEGGDEDDDEPDPKETTEDRVKRLEKALKDQKLQHKKELVLTERKAAAREVATCIRKYKMSKPEVQRSVLYFQKNPDLEGVVPFEEGALRANPALAERIQSPDSGRRNGARREEDAQVVTRGSASGARRAEPFKVEPKLNDYSRVTEALLRSPSVRKLVTVTDD